MNISWLGHSAFIITSNSGVRIITDPFDPSKVGIPFPEVSADIVTSSHNHFDHNHISLVKEYDVFFHNEGTHQFKDVKITSQTAFHDMNKGAQRGENLIFKFEIDGFTVCHLGDIGEVLNKKILDFIRDADILLIPIGGIFTIDARTANEYISYVKPAVVIPMHYMQEGYNFNLGSISPFLELFNDKQIVFRDNEWIDTVLDKDVFTAPTKIVVLKTSNH